VDNNTLDYLDRLEAIISRVKYSLTTQAIFITWLSNNQLKLIDSEQIGMDLSHMQLLNELIGIKEVFTKLGTKGVLIDRLEDLICKLEYYFTSNSIFIAYITENELNITKDIETGLFFQKETLEEELSQYIKDFYNHLQLNKGVSNNG